MFMRERETIKWPANRLLRAFLGITAVVGVTYAATYDRDGHNTLRTCSASEQGNPTTTQKAVGTNIETLLLSYDPNSTTNFARKTEDILDEASGLGGDGAQIGNVREVVEFVCTDEDRGLLLNADGVKLLELVKLIDFTPQDTSSSLVNGIYHS